jgi:hypothetical protein
MKAVLKQIVLAKPVETKRGLRYKFDVKYDVDGKERIASFLSETEDQDEFKEGVENEFIESTREWNGNTYYNIAPPKKKGSSNFSRQLKREQTKYSGFAMSYAKDLVCNGKIPHEDMYSEAEKMFNWMADKDKELENGK